MAWDDPRFVWDDPRMLWDQDPALDTDPETGYDPETSWVHSLPALSATHQADYDAVVRTHHRVGSRLQILDEDERPMWELDAITDGGVSWDTSQAPDRSLDVTVLDVGGHLLRGAPLEEAVEARRFVRLIVEKQIADGWLRFPVFTGPLSSGGLRRQGAEVSIRAAGKEALYLEPYMTWEPVHHSKGALVVDVIHDLLYDLYGERKFRLPTLDTRLHKRFVIPPFVAPWPYVQRLARMAGHTAYFDGEGYLCMRISYPKNVSFAFDEDVVLSAPEIDDDYTTLVNAAVAIGPDPDGPQKPMQVRESLPPANPFSPPAMARHDVPRRALASEEESWDWRFPKSFDKLEGKALKEARRKWVLEVESKKRDDLQARAKAALRVPTKSISFDSLPVPHVVNLIGRLMRITGEYEGQPVDDRFTLRQGFYPATPNAPMTIGSWKPIAANWKSTHHRAGSLR